MGCKQCLSLSQDHVAPFGMDLISNDFSRLSVGDVHAPAEPSAIPALRKVSQERDFFTDDDHKLLDAKIEKAFRAFRVINEEPDLPTLLFNITAEDKT